MEDLKKHLVRDEKVFMSILPELKGSGLAESKRGIQTEAEGKYSHQGILIFNDRAAYEACMKIIQDADWDDEILKKNRYETYVLDHELPD
tara:strand:- start:252 stop:521 length:270 start_codon:yes stop_codon:yes gene_type:complete